MIVGEEDVSCELDGDGGVMLKGRVGVPEKRLKLDEVSLFEIGELWAEEALEAKDRRESLLILVCSVTLCVSCSAALSVS